MYSPPTTQNLTCKGTILIIDNSTPRRRPQRDEAYWSSLLEQVETLPETEPSPETIEQQPLSPMRRAWDEARRAFTEEEMFTVRATGSNKGGLLVDWNGLSGFIPASQLNNFTKLHLESERMRELQRRQNHTLEVKIIEVNENKNRLIFSERAARVDPNDRRSLWERIEPGDVVEGIITNMAKFGAFVDLGGIEGLIHISELSWSRLNHPSDVVQPDQRVRTRVLDVDRRNGRIALSLKRMRPDPWDGIAHRYIEGQVVEGEVNNVVQFGAFVTLEPQLEGLIHISELAEGNFLHPRNVVRNGDRVRAKVLSVDENARRLALTMRGVSQDGVGG